MNTIEVSDFDNKAYVDLDGIDKSNNSVKVRVSFDKDTMIVKVVPDSDNEFGGSKEIQTYEYSPK